VKDAMLDQKLNFAAIDPVIISNLHEKE